jgi:hypothetical protein
LVWSKFEGGRVLLGTSKNGDAVEETTSISVELHVKNAGGTPAWIEKIHGYAELVEGRLKDLASPVGHEAQKFPTFGPIAPSDKDSESLNLVCAGHLRNDQIASIFVRVEYRDAFKSGRVTTCGYTLSGKFLERQVQFPERNYHK